MALEDKPQILLPVQNSFIAVTLLLALIMNLLPWPSLGIRVMPDFVAMALLYWNTYQPRKVGIGLAWLFGLVMDVADAGAFGQHALAYTVLAYLSIVLHRRLLRFSIWEQALHVMLLLWLGQALMALIRFAFGDVLPPWHYYLSSPFAAAIWPAMAYLMQLPQQQIPDSNPL